MADFDRPLKRRGREAAELVGRFLASKRVSVAQLISSPSARTRETIKIILEHAKLKAEPQFDERIYEATLNTLVKVISEVGDDKKTVMLVGHNPGMEELLALLTHDHKRMPTCTLARIKVNPVSWKDIGRGAGQLEWFVTPKDLADT